MLMWIRRSFQTSMKLTIKYMQRQVFIKNFLKKKKVLYYSHWSCVKRYPLFNSLSLSVSHGAIFREKPSNPVLRIPTKKMQDKNSDSANKNPKKANLLDHHSIKHILDESVTEVSRNSLDPFRFPGFPFCSIYLLFL